MRIIVVLIISFLGISLITAQAPQAFNYQGIARNAAGTPIAGADISVLITIQQNINPGIPVYSERHQVTTNQLGLFTLEAGRGDSELGDFTGIQWGSGSYYINVAIDPNGGNDFIDMGTSQLLSVPYALHSGNNSQWQENSNGIHYNEGNVGIGTSTPEHLLTLHGSTGVGNERFYLDINNFSLSNRSFAAAKFSAGSNTTYTSFGHNSETYDIEDFNVADYGGIFTNGAGLHFTAGSTNGIIKFHTGGGGSSLQTERLRINSSGNVGIGTTNPESLLHLDGTFDQGDERLYLTLNNNSVSNRSLVGMKFSAGNSNTITTLGHNSTTYDIDDYYFADFGGLGTTGAGLVLKAGSSNGVILFLTGVGSGQETERLRIANSGNIGIDNNDPASKLQVSNGDVYIDDISSGVIMKSPNGSCWRMTINDDGSVSTTQITCP